MYYTDEYNALIREHFDISDKATRKTIIALEDAEQTQLLTSLSSALYDKIIEKVDKIDFGTIPNSRGDITKVDGFENTVECLRIIRQLVMEYKEDPEVVDVVLTAIENVKNLKPIFMKAYSLNIEFPIVLYNLIVLSIEQSVSFLIAVTIQYVKDPASQSMTAALDKVAYNNAKDNVLYTQLANFNKGCASGETEAMLKEIMKNGGKMNEAANMDECFTNTFGNDDSIEAPVNKVDISPFSDNDDNGDVNNTGVPCPGSECPPDPDEELPCDPTPTMPVNGCGDNKSSNSDSSLSEGVAAIALAISAIAAAGALGFRIVKFLISVMIPVMRNVTYFLYNSRTNLSASMAIQAQFIEMNAYKLQYSTTSDLDDKQKAKTVAKQLKIAEKLKQFSNKIALDHKKAAKDSMKMVADDSKKMTVSDLKNELPANIYTKGSNLF